MCEIKLNAKWKKGGKIGGLIFPIYLGPHRRSKMTQSVVEHLLETDSYPRTTQTFPGSQWRWRRVNVVCKRAIYNDNFMLSAVQNSTS
ncbi:Protein TIC 214 [Frankliniella fusca]|uniref:Protein TIC 214 n=1 Tax=Frankliniella fusca TaxID=407009 RepID=A0AAE1L6V5_9NEOP|nr:Protein TIC 214 [Frankliniella fusca]